MLVNLFILCSLFYMHYNMINEAMNRKMSITPVVSMMGTMFVGSDRYKVVCVKVLSPKTVVVAEFGNFRVKEVDGIDYYDGDVDALYENTIALPSWINEEKWNDDELEDFKKREINKHVFSLRKNHRWIQKGHDAWSTGSIHWGKADEYIDPDF